MFVSNKENNLSENKKQTLTGLTYIATRLSDEYTEEFINQRQFAKKYNLLPGNMYKCLIKVRKKHRGWAFKIKEENL